MPIWKKLLFSALTVAIFLALVEGASRLVWLSLERDAFAARKAKGEAVLRNDRVNFMKRVDGVYGYVLKPGFARGGIAVNAEGFAQRDNVPLARTPGTLRVAAMGESTTQGHHVDTANYPVYLGRILRSLGAGYAGVEILNAGVSGWVSDQVALRAERQVAAYRPDIVVLYVGWNDFQSYDPYAGAPQRSYFEDAYGSSFHGLANEQLKALAVLSAVAGAVHRRLRSRLPVSAARTEDVPAPDSLYRYYLASLDRIVAAFRNRDPGVEIVLSTLVGRWPRGTREQFSSAQGRTWWMKQHELSPADAAAALARFNTLIRRYAEANDLLLVDMAGAFEKLDRARLQWDFAHMSEEGYELMGEILYEALRRAEVARGSPSARREALLTKYALDAAPAPTAAER